MQAKWEQIYISTFVLYLCEILTFDAQVGESDLQARWRPDPSAGISPTRARAQTLGIKKVLLKLALQKYFMTIGSTYKPRSVRSWFDEASKAIIGAIIHLDPTSP